MRFHWAERPGSRPAPPGPRTRVDTGDPPASGQTSARSSGERLRWLQRNTKALALDVKNVMMEALSCDAPKAPAG
jgi:hypothetical protein